MFSSMNSGLRLTTFLCAFVGTVAIATDHPAAGAWKLNAGMSTLKGCPSSMLDRRTLIVPPDIAVASTNPRTAGSGARGAQSFVSRSAVSRDDRTLTMTQVQRFELQAGLRKTIALPTCGWQADSLPPESCEKAGDQPAPPSRDDTVLDEPVA